MPYLVINIGGFTALRVHSCTVIMLRCPYRLSCSPCHHKRAGRATSHNLMLRSDNEYFQFASTCSNQKISRLCGAHSLWSIRCASASLVAGDHGLHGGAIMSGLCIKGPELSQRANVQAQLSCINELQARKLWAFPNSFTAQFLALTIAASDAALITLSPHPLGNLTLHEH